MDFAVFDHEERGDGFNFPAGHGFEIGIHEYGVVGFFGFEPGAEVGEVFVGADREIGERFVFF